MTSPPAIDPWVNVNMGEQDPPPWLLRVKEDTFKGGAGFLKSLEVDELLEQMEAAGVERAVLSIDAERPSEHVLGFVRKHPERFALAASVDPRRLVAGLRELRALHASEPIAMARVVPFMQDLPPTHACHYPLYAECVELGLPISINAGIPGPPVPGECQHPMHLDRVCFDFPELTVVMGHGADPWWSVAIRLMLKYANLHLMTSAYAPRYLPAELLHFMNTRGTRKILYASDHPVLPMERCLREARALDLRPGVLEAYLAENADRLFFAPLRARG